MIVINGTDMVHGTRVSFNQDVFDMICTDLSTFPVARACAASSAVPIVLSTLTLRNYAGGCGFQVPKVLGGSHGSRPETLNPAVLTLPTTCCLPWILKRNHTSIWWMGESDTTWAFEPRWSG